MFFIWEIKIESGIKSDQVDVIYWNHIRLFTKTEHVALFLS